MKLFFKKYFVPHEENDYKPHFLRFETTLLVLSGLLFIEVLFLVSTLVIYPRLNFLAAIVSDVLVDETNINRDVNGVPMLRVNSALVEAARLKAEDMAKRSYFAHTSPDGITPWHWLNVVDYRYTAAGENLAVNFIDSTDVTNAWMSSPTHRANILNKNYTEIGVAAATGSYKGRESIFVVQFFGAPARSAVALVSETELEEAPVASSTEEVETSSLAVLGAAATTSEVIIPPPATANEATSTAGEPILVTEEENMLPAAPVSARASQFEVYFASPRLTLNYLYFIFFTIISLALVLAVFIKINIQYPALIVNGVLMLLVIASVLLVNQYFSFTELAIY